MAYPPLPPPPSVPPPIPEGWNAAAGGSIPPPHGAPGAPGRWEVRTPGSLGAVDAVEAGFRLWARHWRQLALLTFLLTGVTAIVVALIDPGPGLRELIRMFRTGAVPPDLEEPSGLTQALSILSGFVLTPIALLATARIVLGACCGTAPPTKLAVLYGVRRIASTWWLLIAVTLTLLGVAIPAAIVAMILVAVGLAPLALLLLVPIVFVAIRIAVPLLGAFVVDDARGFGAVGRAWRLTEGRWWPTTGAALLAGLVTTTLALLSFVVQLLVSGSGAGAAFATATVGAATNAVIGPIAYAVSAVVYLDLRARRDPTSPPEIRALIERHDPP